MPEPDLSGASIVLLGSFNPAIVHPRWLAEKGLLSQEAASFASGQRSSQQPMIMTPQFTTFSADWLTVQVRQEQLILMTVEEGRDVDLRDFAEGLMSLLPETPVDAMGLNYDAHFRATSQEAWHEFGDRFLPKDVWEGVFPAGPWIARPTGQFVGMRSAIAEVHREPEKIPGFVRVELAPSVRVLPHGIYCGINCHYALQQDGGQRGAAGQYASVLASEWSAAREIHTSIASGIGELT